MADRKKPHAEKTLALLPNRILIHNVMSFLADVHTTRINDQLMVDNSPPNGTHYTDEFKPKGSSLIGFMAPAVEVHIPVSLDVTLKPDWLDVLDGDSSNSWRSRSRRQQLSTLLSTMAGSGDDASAHVQEVVQPSILAGTPWAGPTTPPAKLSHAAPHLAILEAARPSATAPTVDETIVALQEARRGAKRQKGALSATGQLRVAELVKLFAVEEEA